MKEAKKSRKSVLLPAAIGDWTTYKPRTEDLIRASSGSHSPSKLPDKELLAANLSALRLFGNYFGCLQKELDLPFTLLGCRIELVTYVDILKDIDYPIVQFRLDAPGMENIFVCFDMGLANAMINRAVGGSVDSTQTKALTEIEESILEQAASSAVSELFPDLDRSASLKYLNAPNIYFDQHFDENLTLALVDIDVSAGKKIKGNVLLVLPLKDLLLMSNKGLHRQPADISRLPAAIAGRVTTPVTAVLGHTYISAKELYEMEPGDVIALDSNIHDLLHVTIGEGLNLLAQPAIKDDRLCLRILNSGTSKVEKIKVRQQEQAATRTEPVRSQDPSDIEDGPGEEQISYDEASDKDENAGDEEITDAADTEEV